MNLRTRSLWFMAAVATMVLGIASVFVYRLVSVADDPQLARQIGWNLLFIGLSAGILAAGAAWWVVRRVMMPLRRLSEAMSEMARTGELRSDSSSEVVRARRVSSIRRTSAPPPAVAKSLRS